MRIPYWERPEPADAWCYCGAAMYLANTSWIECINPYCPYPEGSVKYDGAKL